MPAAANELPADLDAVVQNALAEDIGDGDRNATLAAADRVAGARVVARENAILAGAPWFDAVFKRLDCSITVDWHYREGQRMAAETAVCSIRGPVRAVLAAERTALNFLQLLSGVASATRDYVERVKGTHTRIVDTRKTLPGLRSAQKYAVRRGGGHNHRFGLFDAILIKENHILAVGSIAATVRAAREQSPTLWLQVEIENLAELEAALAAGADAVLLDNMPSHLLARAVNMAKAHRRRSGRALVIEASGDIGMANVREVADTGVDRISIGALTRHVRSVNFSLRVAADGRP